MSELQRLHRGVHVKNNRELETLEHRNDVLRRRLKRQGLTDPDKEWKKMLKEENAEMMKKLPGSPDGSTSIPLQPMTDLIEIKHTKEDLDLLINGCEYFEQRGNKPFKALRIKLEERLNEYMTQHAPLSPDAPTRLSEDESPSLPSKPNENTD